MAKSTSAEESQLRKRARRRLIGAIALVTIIAVFLPMALEHEPRPFNQDISIRIPSPNSGVFTSKIVPVTPDAKSVADRAPGTPSQSDSPAAKDAPTGAAAVTAKPVEGERTPPAYDAAAALQIPPSTDPPKAQAKLAAQRTDDKTAPTPKAAADPSAVHRARPDAKSAASYVVQVAALNDAAKAKQIQDQIAAAGVKSYTEMVPTQKGNVTRVRAGPFATRDEAEKTRDKLKGMGMNGNLIAQ